MNKIVLGFVLCAFSVSSFAAEMMTKTEFKKVHTHYTKVGSVTTAGETSAAEAKAELSKKADEKGGDIYVLTSGNTNNKMHASANVYKKK